MTSRPVFPLQRAEFADRLLGGEAAIDRLMASEGEACRHPAGAVIVPGGEEHAYVYRLTRGWVARVRSLGDGRTPVLAVFLPQELFALKSMYLRVHPDSLVASSAVEAQRIDCRRLHALAVENADVMVRITHQLLEDERQLHNCVTLLSAGAARERLAALIVDLRGRLVLGGHIAPDASVFSTPFTQQDLGDKAGLSTIHVNRVLKEFREDELATFRRGQVRVLNLGKLWALASPLLDAFQKTQPAFGAPERLGVAAAPA